MQDYEDATSFLGQWGRFQLQVFFLMSFAVMPNGFGAVILVFLTEAPSHHCRIPDVNLTADWYDAIIPIEVVNGKPEQSRCSRYRLDVVRNLSAQGFLPGRHVNLTDLEQESCVDGWSYSKDVYQSTIVTEFDLVCSEQWKKPFTSTILFLGFLCGAFISGQLSDRFGRKPVFFVTIAVRACFSFATIFSPSWSVLCILLFISGLGQISNYVTGFVLGAETLTGKARDIFSSIGIGISYAVGYMILPLFAYFLRDWKSLMMGLSLPCLLYLLLWWFITESPRWLLSQGRVEEAEAILRRAAKKNKVEAPQVIFSDYHVHDNKEPEKEQYNFFSLLSTTDIRITTIILCLAWFSFSVGYIGLSLNTSQLHADPYLSCFMSGVVEVPAYISVWLALKYLPRRVSVISLLAIAGVSLFVIQAIPEGLSGVSIALELLGKFALTTGFSYMYPYTAELYPTALRNTATGLCCTVARVGSCISPFLLQLSMYFMYLPHNILGTLTFVCAFATLFLPESFGQPLPQNIQQMQKRQSMKCPFIKRKVSRQSAVSFDSSL